MFDRIEAALRRYELIRPTPERPARLGKAEEFSQWITEYVCPAIEPLLAREDFRRLARWSIEHLAPGSKGEARRLVENVDRALVTAAQSLIAWMSSRGLREAMEREAGRSVSAAPRANPTKTKSTTIGRRTVADFVAQRPWHDLVSEFDFFAPVCELNLRNREAWLGPNSQMTQILEFCPYSRPHLSHPGDCIARCLLARVEYWQSDLRRLLVKCENLSRGRSATNAKSKQRAHEAFAELNRLRQQLEDTCLHDVHAKPRQAAAALTQIYGAYRSRADLSWLGSTHELVGNAATLRYFVDRRADVTVVEAVAAALTETAELARAEIDPEEAIATKVRECPLVLIDGPGRRELYWQQHILDRPWQKRGRAWTLILALAQKAKHGQGVDEADDLGISLKDAKGDLVRLLPSVLHKRIDVVRGVYTLHMPGNQIYVARFDQEDRLREIS